ncbi:MAG: efflux RND transporter periplasmic adaptor subunit [Muribaculaceae bacterium]|jgi:HlyD family secretion protein|nr:efflux RND transporter periplasmic adaptor subunit [Muribaculaceae bacterium]
MKRKGSILLRIATGIMLIAACASCAKKENVSLETVTIGTGEITESVTATGTLESETSVDVGTQVTGIISKLYADYNSRVSKGQVIAEIDKTTLESELKSANSTLESAKFTYDYTRKNYERDYALHKKQLISDYDFETTRKDYDVAKAAYEKSQADRVKAAKNLSYAEIYSPIDGIVVARDVEVGQTVVSNMSVATMFTIADLDHMHVVANVDEADIGEVKVGQQATFTVDAYTNDTFTGVVKQVRINPTTTSNVVTYQVLISTDNSEHKLIPGLTANITIITKDVNNVLTMPLKVLRFIPQKFDNAKGNLPSFDAIADVDKSKLKDPAIPTENMHRGVYVLRDNKLVKTDIVIGTDNGVNVEVKSGLKKGDKVALQYNTGDAAQTDNSSSDSSSPFMPKHPSDDKNKKGSSSNGGNSGGASGGGK